MKYIRKNNNQKYNFLSKQGKIDGIEVAAAVLGTVFASAVFILIIGGAAKMDQEGKGYKTYNSIAISNGVETRVDDISDGESYTGDYKVVYQNDNALLIYVFDNDPSKRYLKSEFVERNIYVTELEDGTYRIDFNREDLTEDKYLEFISELQRNNEDNIQRKRS